MRDLFLWSDLEEDERRASDLPAYHSPGGADGRTDWPTPTALFECLDKEFGFVCDLAASSENTLVPSCFFTEERSALAHAWPRGPCWLNPPFGSAMLQWAKRVVSEARLGSTVVALVPVRSDTGWWHSLVPNATEVRFMRGRLKFRGGKAFAPFPSAIVVVTPSLGPPILRHVVLPRGLAYDS